MTPSLAFCTLPKKWLSIIFERGDPMHLLPVPNLLIRMNLFFAQVQADFHSAEQNNPVNCFVRGDEVRIAKILSRLVQRTEGETIWAWRKSKTVVGVSWQYEISKFIRSFRFTWQKNLFLSFYPTKRSIFYISFCCTQ